ncbi:MAG TPA: 4-(cytidine 5'-diphospho)-2-C-methyl-D-erythritol kinase [Acidimicrobiales bacterium]|nr:4-(cytidine 5'-diphospho)-2-C-methyl-D-erythritol kinase [Acidimicrobiales bacterium]
MAARAGERLTVLLAPAKLTVSLRVTGRRDDGYHLIDAEMVSLDLADELTFRPGWGLDVVSGFDLGYVDPQDNLVGRALKAVGREAHVSLAKRIPAGGGLGGGSSNAAAVMRWAGCDDLEIAESLGADVPFCLHGGRARVRGIGEVLDPLPFVARTITLAMPPFGCSTPAVYAAWDDLGGPRAEGPNDLEPAALAVEPRLARWRDVLGEATGQEPQLAGSGSTWFVDGDYPGDGRIVAHTIPTY